MVIRYQTAVEKEAPYLLLEAMMDGELEVLIR